MRNKTVFGLFYVLSLLPWWVLYGFADLVYFFLYHLFKYRLDIVMGNLLIAFPDKSVDERKTIARDFYHNLSDSFVEIIKMFSMTRADVNKRFVCNYGLLKELVESGKSVHIEGGHFFNWEWVNYGVSVNAPCPFMGTYNPLQNKVFESVFQRLRTRFGTLLIDITHFRSRFHHLTRSIYIFASAADQNPSNLTQAVWLPFFGKPVPFPKGPERLAKAKNAAIVFISFRRVKRGYFKAELNLFSKTPNELPDGEHIKAYRDFVEQHIKQYPSNYLWSHRRWRWTEEAVKYV